MDRVFIQLTAEPLEARPPAQPPSAATGAVTEFRGLVRGEEDGKAIHALIYEAYSPMAERVLGRLADELRQTLGCLAVEIVHRIGTVPVGEAAIVVRVHSRHRREGFLFVQEFMDQLKQEVPIWKVGAVPASVTPPKP